MSPESQWELPPAHHEKRNKNLRDFICYLKLWLLGSALFGFPTHPECSDPALQETQALSSNPWNASRATLTTTSLPSSLLLLPEDWSPLDSLVTN